MAAQAKVVSTTNRWLSGTHEERIAYDMSKEDHLRSRIMFLEEDTGSTFEWTGKIWANHSVKGARSTHDADVHNVPVNEFFHRHLGITTSLIAPSLANTNFIEVADTTSLVVGQDLQIDSIIYGIQSTFARIIAIIGNGVYIDAPLDVPLYIGDTIDIVSTNLAVSGTIASPVSFKIRVNTPEDTWHIQSFILNLVHPTAGDDSRFGDLAALTNGCILRAYNPEEGIWGTFTHWRNNGDIRMDMATMIYTDKAGGGAHSTAGDGAIKARTGAVPSLEGNVTYLELLIQDNLLALISGYLKSQGHIEGR